MAEAPEVTIMLLGDAKVGKSTFLSYVLLSLLLSQAPDHHSTPPPYAHVPISSKLILE